jgi:pimeloyl-ACP methyl ester carboxylesterase
MNLFFLYSIKRQSVLLLYCGLLGSLSLFAQGTADILTYTNKKGKKESIRNTKDLAQKREQVLTRIQQVTGPLPDFINRYVPKAIFLDSMVNTVFTRYSIHLESFPGEVVPALLYVPNKPRDGTRGAAVLALHGTGAKGKYLVDSSEAGPNRATATELAYRGYIVMAPDYPGFGELAGHDFSKDRFESGMMQSVFNNMRCVDYLQSRQDVDPDKIGAIGHSLGGHTAMFLGAFDERIKIIVASCGWTQFEDYDAGQKVTQQYGGKLAPWAQDLYMPLVREKFGLDPDRMPFNFDEMIAILAPRYFFSNSPVNDANFSVDGVKKGEKSARKVFEQLGVGDRLEVNYPDAGHDFPTAVRQKAYRRIDEVLKGKEKLE